LQAHVHFDKIWISPYKATSKMRDRYKEAKKREKAKSLHLKNDLSL
jgi:hypothetical protein